MGDAEKVGLVFIIIIALFAFYGIGWCTGCDVTQKDLRYSLCKTLMVKTVDYINCNTKNIDEILQILDSKIK